MAEQLKEDMDTDTVNNEWADEENDAEFEENDPDFNDDEVDPDFNDDDFNDDEFLDDEWNENDDNDDDWGDTEIVNETDPYSIGFDEKTEKKRQASAIIAVSPEDIDASMDRKVQQLADELSLPPKTCLLLLRRYKWNVSKIIEVYFVDSDKILLGAGVCIHPEDPAKIKKLQSKDVEMECAICMVDVKMSDTFCLECGHLNVCKGCWVDYLRNKVRSKECVTLTCPTSKCYVTIPEV